MIHPESIPKHEAARYMGVKGEPSASVAELLDRLEPVVRAVIRPCYVFRETTVEHDEQGVHLGCMSVPLTGKSVAEHLKDCGKAVILAATLSSEADKLIRRLAVTDMAESLAADSLCSAAIETVCDLAEQEIFSRINAPYRTWRFSPGYGDLPLELQADLLDALNAQRRIGLTVTENSLLVPTKSVTAIIGISESPVAGSGVGCQNCGMRESCAFRRSGIKCVK